MGRELRIFKAKKSDGDTVMEGTWHYMSWNPQNFHNLKDPAYNLWTLGNDKSILNCMQTQIIVREQGQVGYITSEPSNPDGTNRGGAYTTSVHTNPAGNNRGRTYVASVYTNSDNNKGKGRGSLNEKYPP